MSSLRRERFAWCLFDFANSSFNTVVVTFVFSAFFAHQLVGDARRGDVLWGVAMGLSGVLVGASAPFLGSAADRSRHKHRALVLLSLVCIAATAALFWIGREPGAERAGAATLAVAMALVVVANVAFETVFVFYNAFLPGLGDERTLGRLSGYGWAFGYVGGLACLALCLACIGTDEKPGWIPCEGDLCVRATNLIVAGWFLLFALPAFRWLVDRTRQGAAEGGAETSSWRRVLATVKGLRRNRDLLRLLLARLFYNDALVALIALASLYMSDTLAMPLHEGLTLAIWLNVIAGVGAFGFGYVDDRLGARTVILCSLGLLGAGALLAILVPTKEAFWVAGSLVGLGMGPNQSASRTLLARLTPPGREAELAGLFALSGKSTEWLGMSAFALARELGFSQRVALAPRLGLFALGAVLMWGVDERRGIAARDA